MTIECQKYVKLAKTYQLQTDVRTYKLYPKLVKQMSKDMNKVLKIFTKMKQKDVKEN